MLGEILNDIWTIKLRARQKTNGDSMCYDSFYKGDYKMLKEKTTKELEDLKQARDQSVSRIAWYSKHLCDEQENIEKCERILQLCESKLIN